jgi:hypothetical protein
MSMNVVGSMVTIVPRNIDGNMETWKRDFKEREKIILKSFHRLIFNGLPNELTNKTKNMRWLFGIKTKQIIKKSRVDEYSQIRPHDDHQDQYSNKR